MGSFFSFSFSSFFHSYWKNFPFIVFLGPPMSEKAVLIFLMALLCCDVVTDYVIDILFYFFTP